jgi:hypothetical protein
MSDCSEKIAAGFTGTAPAEKPGSPSHKNLAKQKEFLANAINLAGLKLRYFAPVVESIIQETTGYEGKG